MYYFILYLGVSVAVCMHTVDQILLVVMFYVGVNWSKLK